MVLLSSRGDSFRVCIQNWFRNSFRPTFFGTLEETTAGSVLKGTFGVDPTVKALLFSMFVLLGLFLLVFPESERLGLVGGAIFLVAIAWFGRLISRSEEAEIARALTELLEAPAA